MSFALTTEQVRQQTKTVTRRVGWLRLKPGDLLQAVVKCQGLRKGEHVQKLAVIRVTDIRRETLLRLVDEPEYGLTEVALEGFSHPATYLGPVEFVEMFCTTHRCTPETEVTRIAFEYCAPASEERSDEATQRVTRGGG